MFATHPPYAGTYVNSLDTWDVVIKRVQIDGESCDAQVRILFSSNIGPWGSKHCGFRTCSTLWEKSMRSWVLRFIFRFLLVCRQDRR